MDFSHIKVNWFLLRKLSEGYTYSVRIRGLSENLPSNYTLPLVIDLGYDMCSLSEDVLICDGVHMCCNDERTSTDDIINSTSSETNYTLLTTNSSDVLDCDSDSSSYAIASDDIRVIIGAVSIFLVGIAVGVGISGMLIMLFCFKKKGLCRKSK